jgi:hypothetical protein
MALRQYAPRRRRSTTCNARHHAGACATCRGSHRATNRAARECSSCNSDVAHRRPARATTECVSDVRSRIADADLHSCLFDPPENRSAALRSPFGKHAWKCVTDAALSRRTNVGGVHGIAANCKRSRRSASYVDGASASYGSRSHPVHSSVTSHQQSSSPAGSLSLRVRESRQRQTRRKPGTQSYEAKAIASRYASRAAERVLGG